MILIPNSGYNVTGYEIYLTSPSGYSSRLYFGPTSYQLLEQDIRWTFMSNAFWGENPAGEWTMNVRNTSYGNFSGTWEDFSVQMNMGTLVPEPASLILLASGSSLLLRRNNTRRK